MSTHAHAIVHSATATALAARLPIADALAVLLSERNHVRVTEPDGADGWLADLDAELDSLRSTTIPATLGELPAPAPMNSDPRVASIADRIALADAMAPLVDALLDTEAAVDNITEVRNALADFQDGSE